ncbi:MAG: MbnP family protein [Flavobacteriales bacterium]
MKNISLVAGVLAASILLFSCKKDEEENTTPTPVTPTVTYGEMELEMEHFFGENNFALNSAFTTAAGEQVTFTTAKYYISNIALTKADGSTWRQEESYHLVDLSSPSSAMVHIHDVPTGDYTGLTFTVGVDSTRNVSGAQDGALSVSNNMFWSWNSGYIFVKLEGSSPASSTGSFTYHLGGFQGANKALNTGNFNFGPAMLMIRENAAPVVHMMIDVAQTFDNSATPLSVAATSNVHMPGANAKLVAGNFFSGIEFDHIHN